MIDRIQQKDGNGSVMDDTYENLDPDEQFTLRFSEKGRDTIRAMYRYDADMRLIFQMHRAHASASLPTRDFEGPGMTEILMAEEDAAHPELRESALLPCTADRDPEAHPKDCPRHRPGWQALEELKRAALAEEEDDCR